MVYDAACVNQGKQHRQLEILSQHRSEVISTATMDTVNMVSKLYVENSSAEDNNKVQENTGNATR